MNIDTANSTNGAFDLPVGLLVNGTRYRRVVLTELTGEDEDTLASESMTFSDKLQVILPRRIQTFLDGGPEKVTSAQVASLPAIDAEYIIVCLRRLTFGDTITFPATCPKCGHSQKQDADLSEVELEPLAEISYEVALPTGIQAKIRIPTVSDYAWVQGAIKRLKFREPNVTMMMVRFIEALNGVPLSRDLAQVKKTYQTVQELSIKDRSFLRDYFAKMGGSFDQVFEVTCDSCFHESSIRYADTDGFFKVNGGQ